jgi:hypothetical protein
MVSEKVCLSSCQTCPDENDQCLNWPEWWDCCVLILVNPRVLGFHYYINSKTKVKGECVYFAAVVTTNLSWIPLNTQYFM